MFNRQVILNIHFEIYGEEKWTTRDSIYNLNERPL